MRCEHVKTSRLLAALAGAGLTGLMAAPAARADITGQLSCNIAGGTGAVVSSTRTVSCTFRSNSGPDQFYSGTISRLGLDVGTLTSGTLTYQVLALGTAGPGDLQGNYIGSGVGVTLGRGIGLDALIGGSGNTITLQPLATTTGLGTNVSAGLGALRLQFAGLAQPPRLRPRRRSL